MGQTEPWSRSESPLVSARVATQPETVRLHLQSTSRPEIAGYHKPDLRKVGYQVVSEPGEFWYSGGPVGAGHVEWRRMGR